MAPSRETVDIVDQLGSAILLGLALAGGAVATVVFLLIE